MLRKSVIAAWFAVLSVPALAAGPMAPAETVVVESASPVGIWKVTFPESVKGGLLGNVKWGSMQDEFCQIEKARTGLSVHCLGLRLNGGDVSRGSVRVSGRTIRMAWGSMWTYIALNGTFGSGSQFEGTFSGVHLGFSSDDPDKATGTKLSLSANAPDNGEKSGLLKGVLDEMAKGAFTMPVNARPMDIRILKPDTLGSLGTVQSIIYLGEKVFTNNIAFSVYDVEFANGYLICELRQRSDNTLSGFECG